MCTITIFFALMIIFRKKICLFLLMLVNCSSDLKNFATSQPSASNFNSRSLEQFFITVGQNNFGNKIPFLHAVTNIMLCIFNQVKFKSPCVSQKWTVFEKCHFENGNNWKIIRVCSKSE
jgi:hypothetical protein